MPEHLRALVVILVLAVGVFMFARAPACAMATAPDDFARRRNLWFALTLTAFLAHNFWVYIVIAAVLLVVASRTEPNKMAMYFALLLALPGISGEVPGMGIANYLFEIDYLRLLALTLLLPAYLQLRAQPGVERFGRSLPDKLLAVYLVLGFLQMLEFAPLTTALRKGVVYAFLDIYLPYYVASRYLRTLEQMRDAVMAFAVAAAVLSAVLFFEFAKYWLLYPSLEQALQARWGWGNYLPRAGNLRASGTAGHAIVAGYTIAVAFGLYLYLKKAIPTRVLWGLGGLVLVAGLLGPLSRGPWVGAAAMVLVFVALGPSPVVGLVRLGLLGVAALPVLLATPIGDKIIDHLPFIGTVDAENVYARQRLAEVSLQVFLERPLLGSYDFIETPAMQALRGNDGIIDLVNTYVVVGLSAGAIGLALFVGSFLASGYGIYKAMRQLDRNDERHALGQALIATLIGIMLIIGTVSPVLIIPTLSWAMIGLGVAYARMPALATVAEPAAPPRRMHGAPLRAGLPR